jgi:hypothetical protein
VTRYLSSPDNQFQPRQKVKVNHQDGHARIALVLGRVADMDGDVYYEVRVSTATLAECFDERMLSVPSSSDLEAEEELCRRLFPPGFRL